MYTVLSKVCGRPYLIQNTESTASTAKHQITLLPILDLTVWQSDSLIVNNIVNTGRLVNLKTLGNNLRVIIIIANNSRM